MKRLTIYVIAMLSFVTTIRAQIPREIFGLSLDGTAEIYKRELERKGLKLDEVSNSTFIDVEQKFYFEDVEWTSLMISIYKDAAQFISFFLETKDSNKCYKAFESIVNKLYTKYKKYYYDSKFEPYKDNTGAYAELSLVDRVNGTVIELWMEHHTDGKDSKLCLKLIDLKHQ